MAFFAAEGWKLLQRASDVADAQIGMLWIQHLKDHVFAVLQFADHRVEFLFVGGGLLVDADDDQTGLQLLHIRKGTGADRLNDHAGGVNLGRLRRGEVANNETEFGFACVALVAGFLFVLLVVLVRRRPYRGRRWLPWRPGLPSRMIAQADRGAGTAAGDFIDQVVAILDGAAVDGGDDVAGLESGLVRRAAGFDLLHEHAVLEAIDAVDGAGKTLR